MAHTVEEYVQLFQPNLDEQVEHGLVTNNLDMNGAMVQYNGGKTIRIAKITTSGMKDYNRATGFTTGASTLDWETFTMDMDRSNEFILDSQDVDESQFLPTASQLMADFQTTHVIPEIDAYRLSKLSAYAHGAGNEKVSYVPAKETIIAQLKADLKTVKEAGAINPVIYMSYDALEILEQADGVTRNLDANGEKDLNTKIKSFDGVQIIPTPKARLKTAYTFTTGFAPTVGAVDTNWIIAVPSYVMAVNKLEKLRIFLPDTNQSADAWKIQYRRYHDLFVADNKLVGLFANFYDAYAV